MKHLRRVLIGGILLGLLALALALLAAGGPSALAQGDIIYVDADAPSPGDGEDWTTAYTDLQDALADAEAGQQIWVAAGTYTPSVEHGGSGDRYWSYQMVNGVAIYGGFDPDAGDTEWEDRNWEANPTILSGNIGDEATNADNAYHVFYHPDGLALDDTAVLDGFAITGGNASADSPPHYYGGGMYNAWYSSPTLINCTFSNNSAMFGGGLHNEWYSSPTVTNCTFKNNTTGQGGGGMKNNYSSSPVLANCTFQDNSGASGGGINNLSSSPVLTDCTFTGNTALVGGGMRNTNDSSPELTNVTFCANSAIDSGGGMSNDDSSPTLTNCQFIGNIANSDGTLGGDGGGMHNQDGSNPVLSGTQFLDNTASNGGGMHNGDESSPELTGVSFLGNTATADGGGMHNYPNSSPVLANVAFIGNAAAVDGGGMSNGDSSPTLTNVTFSRNTAGNNGGGIYNWQSFPTLTNCILWGDTVGGLPSELYNSDSIPVVTYSDIQGGYEGEGNIDADPLFVDAGSGDIHLGPDSPCIDAGSNAAPHLPGLDFEGDPRLVDGDGDGNATADMGLDEYLVAYYVDADAQGGDNGSTWEDAFTTLQPALDLGTAGEQIWVAAGVYTPTVEHGGSGDRYRSFQLKNGVALYGGFDPSVGDVAWEDRDWVANPTILSGDLNGDDGPGFANNDENCYHVFHHPDGVDLDATAALNGFTVTAGNANHPSDRGFQLGGGMRNSLSSPSLHNCTFSNNASIAEGGGIYNWTSSPLLYNCTFTGNSASHGGGINNTLSSPTLAKCLFSGNSAAGEGGGMRNFTDSSPELTNCTFDGNFAGTNGGGMANVASASPVLVNCTFWGNSAAADGGGLYNAGNSSPVLTNCTFWANSAGADGGGIHNLNNGSPTVTNSILWADTAGGLPNEIVDVDSSPVVTYSDVQGSYPGTGNLDLYPGFVDPDNGDFHLHPCSPCIDAGDNTAPFLPAHDFEGDPRIVDGDGNGTATVDLGVDELAAPGTCLQLYLPLVLK